MLGSLFSAIFLFVLSLSQLTHATPVELIAFAPVITSPTAESVWIAGMEEAVSWKTDNVPAQARNYTLTVLLGHVTDGSSSENLDTHHPLATQVPIMAGSTTVTTPSNSTFGTEYFIVLVGDSGDTSQRFTIFPSI